MRADKASMGRSLRNANEAIAMLQTAEAGIAEIGDTLVRMRELAVHAANGSLTDTERAHVNTEYTELRDEIDRIAAVTEYNGQSLLTGAGGGAGGIVDGDGDAASQFFFQIGFQNSADDQLEVQIKTQIGAQVQASNVSTAADGQAAIDTIDLALNASNGHFASRSNLGGAIRSLNTIVDHLHAQSQNFETSIGAARDVDVGAESMNFTKNQVLQNAGIAMLSQANAQSNAALRLLS